MSKIEAGIYKGRCVENSVEHGHSQQGNEQISVLIALKDLPGRTVTSYLNFSDNAMPYTIDRLVLAGWTRGNQDPKFPGISKNEIDVEIRYEMYGGKERMKVDIVSAGRPPMKAPMSAQEQRGVMDRLAKASMQDPQTASAATPASGGQTPEGKIAL